MSWGRTQHKESDYSCLWVLPASLWLTERIFISCSGLSALSPKSYLENQAITHILNHGAIIIFPHDCLHVLTIFHSHRFEKRVFRSQDKLAAQLPGIVS